MEIVQSKNGSDIVENLALVKEYMSEKDYNSLHSGSFSKFLVSLGLVSNEELKKVIDYAVEIGAIEKGNLKVNDLIHLVNDLNKIQHSEEMFKAAKAGADFGKDLKNFSRNPMTATRLMEWNRVNGVPIRDNDGNLNENVYDEHKAYDEFEKNKNNNNVTNEYPKEETPISFADDFMSSLNDELENTHPIDINEPDNVINFNDFQTDTDSLNGQIDEVRKRREDLTNFDPGVINFNDLNDNYWMDEQNGMSRGRGGRAA